MWRAKIHPIKNGSRYRIFDRDSALSFRKLFRSLEDDADFSAWYTKLLAICSYQAFYWEHPPLTLKTFDHDAEFVLIDASLLASMRPEPGPFESQFEDCPEEDVVIFPNLGGDAVLIAPRPIGPAKAYPHLAAFVRHAPSSQVSTLWRQTAQIVREHLTSKPRWLSTAGLGVAWLHIRLDTQPKYYSYAPYKQRSLKEPKAEL